MVAASMLRRHATVEASGHGVTIGALHPAYRTGRSMFPSRVFDPDEVQRVLKDGHQSRKIGNCSEACATEVRLWLEGSRTPLSVDDELHEIGDPSSRKSAIMSMLETGRITRPETEELISDFGLADA